MYHLYADDTQYMSLKIKDATVAKAKIDRSLLHVKDGNMFKLFDDQTEFLIVSCEHQSVTKFELQIEGVTINPSNSVRVLK